MWATFERFEIKMALQQARTCSQLGKDADEDVQWLMTLPHIKRQRKKLDPELIREELREYGAWDTEDLLDEEMNWMRILWCAACDISEEHFMRSRGA